MNASSGPFAARHCAEHVARGGHLNHVRDPVRAFPLAARPMQHEAAIGAHGPATQDRLRRDRLVLRFEAHLLEHILQPHGQRLVHDDAERTLVGVLADDGHRLGKIRIGERRHRDQQVVREARLVAHGQSVWACDAVRSRNSGDSAALHPPTGELPFVGEAQHAVFTRQLRRKRVERTRELENLDRGRVEVGIAAGSADDGLFRAHRSHLQPLPAPGWPRRSVHGRRLGS